MQQKTLDFDLEIKAVGDSGEIEGYGSVFDVVDLENDIISSGAFSESLAWWKEKGALPSMLWYHNAKEPLGVWSIVGEDDHGLHVSGKMLIEKSAFAREKYEFVREGAIRGLSVGFKTLEKSLDHIKRAIRITKARLFEISLCTLPMNQEAGITLVKSQDMLPTEREFEKFLRDAGYSKAQAAGIVANGYKSVLRGERVEGISLAELKQAMDKLQNAVMAR